MPEHDLLMQINHDIKTLCQTVGKIDEKVDSAIRSNVKHDEEYEKLECRVTVLEHKDIYRTGAAGGIALVVSWIMGWIR